jgi:hypothetical protein
VGARADSRTGIVGQRSGTAIPTVTGSRFGREQAAELSLGAAVDIPRQRLFPPFPWRVGAGQRHRTPSEAFGFLGLSEKGLQALPDIDRVMARRAVTMKHAVRRT